MDQVLQCLMASHQFLLSRKACVMTSLTTYDKSDEALVKVTRLCWSLKSLDINQQADGQRQSEEGKRRWIERTEEQKRQTRESGEERGERS